MSNNNTFFKPTPLYKEFMILDLIEKNKNITQREMSIAIGVAVSMVNGYIDEYEKKGYLKRKYLSTKSVEYCITKKGIERKKVLNIGYLHAAQGIYASAKSNIEVFLNQIIEKGFKKILLYGAGEVAEILLQVINDYHNCPLEVLAVIDDEVEKQSQLLASTKIISRDDIPRFEHDGILISSYKNNNSIYEKLVNMNYPASKIIGFFDR